MYICSFTATGNEDSNLGTESEKGEDSNSVDAFVQSKLHTPLTFQLLKQLCSNSLIFLKVTIRMEIQQKSSTVLLNSALLPQQKKTTMTTPQRRN